MKLVSSWRTLMSWLALAAFSGQILGAETFRIATYNVNNYLLEPIGNRPAKSAEAKSKIRESLRAAKPDVLALQEIGGLSALLDLRRLLKADGLDFPYWEHVPGFDTNIQVAVLSRFPIIARRSHTNDSFLLFGRRFRVSRGFAEVDIQVHPRYQFTLFTAHLKSRLPVPEADQAELRLEEAKILREKIDARLTATPNANIVVLGDLNDTKDMLPIRTLYGRGNRNLLDVRPAEQNGDNQPHANPRFDPPWITWTHYYGKEDSYSRIDYILLSQGMAREWDPSNTRIVRVPNWAVGSDHRPIVATFWAEDR